MNNTPHCFVVMDKWAYNSVKSILQALIYRITYSNCLVLLVLLTKTSHSFIRYLIPLNITFKRPNLIVVKINHRSRATSVFPVFHYLLEFAQTHVHWVDHAIQLSHALPPPSPPVFNSIFSWLSGGVIYTSSFWIALKGNYSM